MAQVRGKFTVQTITRNSYDPSGAQVTLRCQYSNNPEDNSFSAATPNGEISMSVTNPAAVEHFVLGKSFYVDFTAVDE